MTARHLRSRKRRLPERAGIAAALVVGLVAATTITMTSSQAVVPPAPVAVPAGVLTLQTGAIDKIVYDRAGDGYDALNPGSDSAQTLSQAAGCKLATGGAGLVGIRGFVGTSTTQVASFLNNSIGVAEKRTGTSCYQVSAPLERLELTFDGADLTGTFSTPFVRSAYLDVELKGGSRILATASLDGAVTGYFEMQSGGSVGTTGPLPGGVTPNAIFTCSTAADSGADAGIADNCRWPISVPSWLGDDDGIDFDTLVLEAVAYPSRDRSSDDGPKGSFSLEGGADGNVATSLAAPPSTIPTGASVFELAEYFDGILPCLGTASEPGTGTEPAIDLTRLTDADKTDPTSCELIPYTLSNGDSSLQFLKPSTEPYTQFVLTVTWVLPVSAPAQVPVTKVDYELGGPVVDLGWCPDPVFTGGVLTGINDPLNNPLVTDQDGVTTNNTQFACLGSQSATVVDDQPDYVTVTEQIYLLGDVLMRK